MNARMLVMLGFASCLSLSCPAQGTFQNLNFESAVLPSIPAGQFGVPVPIASGLPGWTASRTGALGTIDITQVSHNNYTLGQPNVGVLGPFWSDPLFFETSIIDGQYSALLQAGAAGGNLYATSISQLGMVPGNALSLQMKVYGDLAAGTSYFGASFAGQSISLTPVGSGTNYTLYAGDISSFAGQMGELRFTALPIGFASTFVGLDSIVFSTVPEPRTWALLALGSALFWSAARRRGKSN